MVSDNERKNTSKTVLKFLCSYGGKILPRPGDGKLRYVGGLTRVLAVDRSISFAELMVKLGEFCGYSVELKCQLPNGDLETLVSVKSEEELAIIIEEYDRSAPGSKVRAVLSPPKSLKTVSPPSSLDLSPAYAVHGTVATDSPTVVGSRFGKAYHYLNCGRETRRLLRSDPRCFRNWH